MIAGIIDNMTALFTKVGFITEGDNENEEGEEEVYVDLDDMQGDGNDENADFAKKKNENQRDIVMRQVKQINEKSKLEMVFKYFFIFLLVKFSFL